MGVTLHNGTHSASNRRPCVVNTTANEGSVEWSPFTMGDLKLNAGIQSKAGHAEDTFLGSFRRTYYLEYMRGPRKKVLAVSIETATS